MLTAKLRFKFDSDREAQIIAVSLSPEMRHNIPKTTVSLQTQDNNISLMIQAEEISALRAACNSYLRWINTALSVQNIL